MRNRAKTRAKLVIGAFIALWLGAAIMPCVMAASACDLQNSTCREGSSSGTKATAPSCEQASTVCAVPETNAPVSSLFEFTTGPAFTVTLPAEIIAPVVVPPLAVTQPRARPPHTPVYLEHLALLN